MTSEGFERIHVPSGVFGVAADATVRVTLSGPPTSPVNVCLNLYQPDCVMWITGGWSGWGFDGFASQRLALLLAAITNPLASVPTLNTKSRSLFPLVSLIVEDQSKRLSGFAIAKSTSR